MVDWMLRFSFCLDAHFLFLNPGFLILSLWTLSFPFGGDV